ncbi:Arc family DNA-binding protein [Paracoccus sp. P2]|uniref:Arc family DNA-binding protein n=1 Tax=Paracoccus sp. P2 TaxID=3248840 RepID=UPI00391FB7BB
MVQSEFTANSERERMSAIQSRAGSGETVATMLRVPRELRDQIKRQADHQGRSMNTHIVMILKEAAGDAVGAQAPAAKTIQNEKEA